MAGEGAKTGGEIISNVRYVDDAAIRKHEGLANSAG